jgi:vacuolar iron transporter family protein
MSSLARQLVLDEIFDLALYRALRDVAQGPQRDILDELIVVETQHVAYWQRFFALEKLTTLDPGRRLKLRVLTAVCRLFGAGAIQVVLEAIEVHGVRKYLRVWKRFQDHPLGGAVRGILEDEFKHEDMLVTGAAEHRINPERVRNVFLGLNDGLVEILGAVSGFFAAFGNPIAVLAAGVVIVVVSAIVAFLSGMDVRRRIVLNVAVTGIAVVVTYGIGLLAKAVLGISI